MVDSTTKGPGMASMTWQAPQADDLPWFISVDDHVVEPPTVWTDRLPAKYLDVGPRYARRRVGLTRWQQGAFVTEADAGGAETDVWLFGDVGQPGRRHNAAERRERGVM